MEVQGVLSYLTRLQKDPGSGTHRREGSTSWAAIGAALVPTLITACAFVFGFCILRPRYRNIYAPRTYFRTVARKDRTPSSSPTSWSWLHDFRTVDDKFVLRHSSLDAYLFLRFLRMLVLICFVGCCLTWPILFSVNATGGGEATQLDRISFSNVADPNRLYAHVAVAWVFFGFILLLVTRERVFLVGLRQAHATVRLNATRLSSRVILFLSVPPECLEEANLHRVFGKDAVRSWPVANVSKLEDLVSKRNSKVDDLETVELKLLKSQNNTQDSSTRNGHGREAARPGHRSGYLVGKKVDSITANRKALSEIASAVEELRSEDPKKRRHKGAIFVEYKDLLSAHQAYQTIRNPSALSFQPKLIGVQPKEVNWGNLNLDPGVRITYAYVATAVAVATVILWSIPVGLLGTISNISYLTDKVKFLRFINKLPDSVLGLIEGFVPPFLLSTLVSYVPFWFRYVAIISGKPTTVEAAKWAQTWYFIFQVVQVFLVTTVSSGVATVVTKIATAPTGVPKLLAKNLPKASNFYLTYFIIQGLGTATKNLINYSDLIWYVFNSYRSSTPRQKFNNYSRMKGISWFNAYPKFTNLAVIAIAYSCIAPLVLGFAMVGLSLFYLTYRYNLLYVIQVKIETRGAAHALALQHLMTGIYLAELCLIGLFGIKKAEGPSALAVLLLVSTVIHHITTNEYLAPLERFLPIDLLSEDEEQPLLSNESPPSATASRSRSIYHRLSTGHLPALLHDPFARFLEPHVFASQDALRPWLEDPEAEFNEAATYTDDQLKNAYLNPALTSKTPKIWLPKDPAGVSKEEVRENEEAGLACTDEGAELNEKGKVRWNTDDFETVPIFKAPALY